MRLVWDLRYFSMTPSVSHFENSNLTRMWRGIMGLVNEF
jgi:hypothetical protein